MEEVLILPMTAGQEMDDGGWLRSETFRETWEGKTDRKNMEEPSLTEWVERTHRRPENTLLLWVGGEPAGLASYAFRGREGEIRELYLLREFQGRGLGRALLAETLAALGRRDRIFVRVPRALPRAVEFFTRRGFAPVGKPGADPVELVLKRS